MFAYCNNNPVLMCDYTGTILKISGGPNEISRLIQRMIFLVSLSILSDDKIGFDGDTIMIIEKRDNPSHAAGTELLRLLVDDDNTVTLCYSFFKTDLGSNTSSENWSEGKEVDSFIEIDATDINTYPHYTPLYVVLGHELIHALHMADGSRNPETEESRTIGRDGFSNDIITENAIRTEHGLSLRSF